MPLLTYKWDRDAVAKFVAAKEEFWRHDGLGHWAFRADGDYAGWGGFQKEGQEWDYGLVLRPKYFGWGLHISKQAFAFACADQRIPYVTFLLPPSRKKLGALARIGARPVGKVLYNGEVFLKYRLETA